jgi:AraC-like DNA-binding protein
MSLKSDNQVCFFDKLDSLVEATQQRDERFTALVLIKSGALTVSNNLGNSVLVAKECGMVASDSPPTTFRLTTTTYAVSCLIPPKSVALAPAADGAVVVSKVAASTQLRTLFQLGLEIKDDDSELTFRLRDAIGEAVLAAYLAGAKGQSQLGLPAAVRKVCAYIDANYNEPCDLNRLSEIAGVSRGHLGSEFRKRLGKSPVRYLWEFRTRRAVEILNSTSLALIEIAERCGYKSHFHLSREVKALTGFSPKELRENASLADSFSSDRHH